MIYESTIFHSESEENFFERGEQGNPIDGN